MVVFSVVEYAFNLLGEIYFSVMQKLIHKKSHIWLRVTATLVLAVGLIYVSYRVDLSEIASSIFTIDFRADLQNPEVSHSQ